MRLLMVSLCTAVMLSTPLMKKAEAASGFARALDAISALEDEDQLPEGGLDDDTEEEMTLRSRGRAFAASDLPCWFNPWVAIDRLLSPLPVPGPADRSATPLRGKQARWPSDLSSRRQAWLQLFLF